LFVKKKGIDKKILHSDFWGTRLEKYQRSLADDLKSVDWENVKATAPFYLFTPQNEKLKSKYFKFLSLNDIFIKSSIGIFTHRDFFLVDTDSKILTSRIQKFKKSETATEIKKEFDLADTRDWEIEVALKEIKKNEIVIKAYDYRPFDKRFVCYNIEMFDRGCSRFELMKSFLQSKDNLGLVTGRAGQNVTPHLSWNLVSISNTLTDANLFSRGGACIFPLYLFLKKGNTLFVSEPVVSYGKRKIETDDFELIENFLGTFRDYIDALYKQHFSPEEIFGYIYSILHSPTYRSKYSEFLKIDFPRIPFTEDIKIFKQLAKLGNELIDAHLLKKKENFNSKLGIYKATNNHLVEKPTFKMEKNKGKLFINSVSYFDNVPQNIYDFYIGGYQVIDKYLKDRKGRDLVGGEIDNIIDTIRAIAFTIDQMKRIDSLTKNWI